MTPTPLLLLVAAAVGVDTGWTPLESGGYEYIIQIPAEQLESLRAGGEFGSDFPSDTGAIRSFKIVIGDGPVMNQGKELPADARISLKPLVDDDGRPWRSGQGGVQRPGPREEGPAGATASAIQGTRFPPVDVTNRAGSDGTRAAPASDAVRPGTIEGLPSPPNDSPLADDPLLPFSRGARPQADAETGSRATRDRTRTERAQAEVTTEKAFAEEDQNEGPTPADAEKTAKANEPETWSRSKFQWTLLVLGLIFCGGLNGYLGWLALDFRNRYLELLRDLDTQPVDDLAAESAGRDQPDDEEEAGFAEPPRRELVRSAETFVGRRESSRRRDREDDGYDED